MDANIPPRVQAALEGRFNSTQLPNEEAEIFYNNLAEAMALYPSEAELAWSAEMKERYRTQGGLSVNEVDQLVYQFPDSDQHAVLDFDPGEFEAEDTEGK